MEKQRFRNGISHHCIKIIHKDETVEEIMISDELGEDCNAYEFKDKCLREDTENSIKRINIINTKNVEFKNKQKRILSDSESACIYMSIQERIDNKKKELETIEIQEIKDMLKEDIKALENVLSKYRDVENYLIENNLISY